MIGDAQGDRRTILIADTFNFAVVQSPPKRLAPRFVFDEDAEAIDVPPEMWIERCPIRLQICGSRQSAADAARQEGDPMIACARLAVKRRVRRSSA
jgi:hypothetical protein